MVKKVKRSVKREWILYVVFLVSFFFRVVDVVEVGERGRGR